MFAQVILSKATPSLDRIYHYSIPQNLKDKISVGSQVLIPFGNRKTIGYVIGFVDKAEVIKVKDILEILNETPLFNERSVELAKWLSEYYLSFFITSLRAVMPPGVGAKESQKAKGKRKKDKAEEKIEEKQKLETEIEIGKAPVLNTEQKKASEIINESIDSRKPETILLHGVTGSGKTEIYLQAIAHCLKQGRSVIVLAPEISMAPELVARFKERFIDHLAVIHSDMTIKQRDEAWRKLSLHSASVVFGTRSAIFAPVKNLGLIILDEEYEITYKQEKSPRYHARTVAEKLIKENNAVLVLGSSAPSVETYYRAKKGEYKLLILSKRVEDRPFPFVEILDMHNEEKNNILSKKLRDEISQTLKRKEQVILFINRRGYFTFAMCRSCGNFITCPKCSVSLSYHSRDKKLICGHCGYSVPSNLVCPKCQNSSISFFGTGTQRIEKEVAEIFPAARILRIDRDTIKKRGSIDLAFSTFKEGKADVLIGTQMVAKGLDVKRVTLVGVVSADTALNLPDFRSAEHTFQTLTSVAGRAGRHDMPGKVLIQTFNPDHYAIKYAAAHDYEGFYQEEIEHRKESGYPPFSKMINLIVNGDDESKTKKTMQDLKVFLEKQLSKEQVLGGMPAPISKLRGKYRYEILLKGADLDVLRKAVVECLGKVVKLEGVRISVDIEPMSLM